MTKFNSLFDFDDYKKYVHEWLLKMPHGGHGQLSRIAKHLSISSVSVSHVFNGVRDLSEEQAVEIAEFFGFSELEGDYFLLLVQLERAGSFKLKARVKTQITKVLVQAQDLKSRLTQDVEMDEAAQSQFYSNWFFSGVSLATSIEGLQSLESISKYLGLSRSKVREVLDFLLIYGLVEERKDGFHIGHKHTHLSAKSLLVSRHHANWRLKALENMNELSPEEIFYTGPMTMSVETMREIRRDIVELIDNVLKKVGPSPSEEIACLNIDWFKVRGK